MLKKEIHTALKDFKQWDHNEFEQIKMQVELIQGNINNWTEEGIDTESDEEN